MPIDRSGMTKDELLAECAVLDDIVDRKQAQVDEREGELWNTQLVARGARKILLKATAKLKELGVDPLELLATEIAELPKDEENALSLLMGIPGGMAKGLSRALAGEQAQALGRKPTIEGYALGTSVTERNKARLDLRLTLQRKAEERERRLPVSGETFALKTDAEFRPLKDDLAEDRAASIDLILESGALGTAAGREMDAAMLAGLRPDEVIIEIKTDEAPDDAPDPICTVDGTAIYPDCPYTREMTFGLVVLCDEQNRGIATCRVPGYDDGHRIVLPHSEQVALKTLLRDRFMPNDPEPGRFPGRLWNKLKAVDVVAVEPLGDGES